MAGIAERTSTRLKAKSIVLERGQLANRFTLAWALLVPFQRIKPQARRAWIKSDPAPEPRRGKKAIGLDTGCVYGYNLTAYIIETDEFVSVPAERAYDES